MDRKRKTEELLEAALCNITSDRTLTSKLLEDLIEYMEHDETGERRKEAGQIAAKYVETLQRSNEQLVKVLAIKQKSEKSNSNRFEDLDKDNIFDLIGASAINAKENLS